MHPATLVRNVPTREGRCCGRRRNGLTYCPRGSRESRHTEDAPDHGDSGVWSHCRETRGPFSRRIPMAAFARWCFNHRLSVIGIWIALLIAVSGASMAAGTSYSDAFDLPGTESTKALDLLQKSLPESA